MTQPLVATYPWLTRLQVRSAANAPVGVSVWFATAWLVVLLPLMNAIALGRGRSWFLVAWGAVIATLVVSSRTKRGGVRAQAWPIEARVRDDNLQLCFAEAEPYSCPLGDIEEVRAGAHIGPFGPPGLVTEVSSLRLRGAPWPEVLLLQGLDNYEAVVTRLRQKTGHLRQDRFRMAPAYAINYCVPLLILGVAPISLLPHFGVRSWVAVAVGAALVLWALVALGLTVLVSASFSDTVLSLSFPLRRIALNRSEVQEPVELCVTWWGPLCFVLKAGPRKIKIYPRTLLCYVAFVVRLHAWTTPAAG